jgi:hypothetical protein
MPHFTRSFEGDFLAVREAIESDERFCFVRFHDGEYAILKGGAYRSASGWHIRRGPRGSNVWIKEDLLEALKATMPGYHLGVSPECCARKASHFLRTNQSSPRGRLTYSTLFQNANYERALRMFRGMDAVIVTSGEGDYRVPSDGVNRKWDLDGLVLKLMVAKKPILLAAGPCACIIGHKYWSKAVEIQMKDPSFRPQTIIDVGATLDVVVHDRKTRQYHDKAHALNKHVCQWEGALAPVGEAVATKRMPTLGRKGHETITATSTVRPGNAAPTSRLTHVDPAILVVKKDQRQERRRRTKEFLASHPSRGQWARQRVRKRKRRP